MMTVYERNFPRLREILVYLSQVGVPTKRQDIIDHISAKYPPVDDDLNTVGDDTPRWVNQLLLAEHRSRQSRLGSQGRPGYLGHH